MFETVDHAEVHIPKIFCEGGQRAWAYVERPLHIPWFHLVYRYSVEEDVTLSRCVFLTQVFQLLEFEKLKGIEVEEVQIVLPKYMTGAGRWIMEPLAEIWEGIEPETDGQRAFIYVLVNNQRYLHAGITNSESELTDCQLVFSTPNSKRSSSKQGEIGNDNATRQI